jgi:hypothetical protein
MLRPAPEFEADVGSVLVRVEVIAGALALLSGVISAVRFRVDGYAPAWWIGVALVAIGIPPVVGAGNAHFAGVYGAATVVGIIAVLLAIQSPEVNSGISRVRGPVVATTGLAALWCVLSIAPLSVDNSRVIEAFVTALYAVVALLAEQRLRASRRATWPGIVTLACGLSLSHLTSAVVPVGHPLHGGGPALVLLTTLAVIVVCVVSDLHAVSALQRRLAYESKIRQTEAERERRRSERRFSETLHEVRSTVLALEGGVRRLEVSPPAATPPEPSSSAADTTLSTPASTLAAARVAEIARVRALV